MNLLPLALGFLAWQFFGKKNKESSVLGGGIGKLLSNPDAIGMLTSFAKLSDKTTTTAEKTSALIEMLSSPVIFEVAKSLFKSAAETAASTSANTSTATKETADNIKKAPENFSATDISDESKQFFKPVETVAGVEISKKLYHLYDNWYLKNK